MTKAIEDVARLQRGRGSGNPPAKPVRFKAVPLSQTRREFHRWVCRNLLPDAALTILAGRGGAAKTSIFMAWAAAITNARPFPDGTLYRLGKRPVLIWCGDESTAELQGMAEAAGCDMDLIFVIKPDIGADDDPEEAIEFDPAMHMAQLHEVVAQIKKATRSDLGMIGIDPIAQGVSGEMKDHGAAMRKLQPFASLAQRQHCPVVGIHHFSKSSEDKPAVDRVTGTAAFVNKARMVLVAELDYDADTGKPLSTGQMLRVKAKIKEPSGGYRYEVIGHRLDVSERERRAHELEDDDLVVGRVEWRGETDAVADRVVAQNESNRVGGKQSAKALRAAADWLRDRLSSGEPVLATVLEDEAQQDGHKRSTLHDAAKAIGVQRSGGYRGKPSEWSLTVNESKESKNPKDSESQGQDDAKSTPTAEHREHRRPARKRHVE